MTYETLEALRANLLSPSILAFVIGLLAFWAKSDLSLPEPIYQALTIYLLLAVGLKGGVALSQTPIAALLVPALGAVLVGLLTPASAYFVLRRLGRLPKIDAGAIAAHYGSVSAVTFVAAVAYLDKVGTPYEGFAPALLALLEIPGIVVALALARAGGGERLRPLVHELLTGRGIVLLAGGIAIGAVAGVDRVASAKPFFVDLFPGALVLFLLEMGRVAAQRLAELRGRRLFLTLFAVGVPLVHGVAGVAVGVACGLSPGGAALLGTLAASASYIAAPAAVRAALPKANLALCLAPAVGITLPFNLAFGIPLYAALANRWAGG